MTDDNKNISALRDYPEETICPSCGKFVGAYARCPYCGTKHTRRISIRFFRLFSLVMAVVGVLLVWLAARGIQAPLIKIDEIMPTMAFAYVRVDGDVVNTRIYDDGGVSFRVDDGTGRLLVRAYDDIGKMLIEEDRVPSPGDSVSAEGTLQLREDFVQMIVNVPEKIGITRAPAREMSIAGLDDGKIGEKVILSGTVGGERTFSKGSSITISDGTGSIDVVIWDSIRNRFGRKEELLQPGRSVTVRGTLKEYENKLQLYIDYPGDITGKGDRNTGPAAPSAPKTAKTGAKKIDIDEVTRDRINQPAEIVGQVSKISTFPKGRKIQLTDPTGSVEVVIWNSVFDRIPDSADLIKEGVFLKVTGRVGEYHGTIQVLPRSPDQVRREGAD